MYSVTYFSEGQISRGSNYLQQERDGARLPRDRPSPPRGDPGKCQNTNYFISSCHCLY